MAQHRMNGRFQQKQDSAANWEANDLLLLDGEQALAKTASGVIRMKVGDGTKKFSQLSFTDEPIYGSINAHIQDPTAHVAFTATLPFAPATTAVTGTAATVSRSDHVHPLQTAITGNAASATKLVTARTISLSGDATGSISFNGTANVAIPATQAATGVTEGSYGPAANATPAFGASFEVPFVTVDAKGRVTEAASRTVTLPANPNSDTKVTNTQAATTKAYVTGTTSATTNTGTQVFDTGVFLDTTAGHLTAVQFNGALNGNASSATTATTATSAASATSATTATKLATARTISLTGAVTGSGTFDGSANMTIATTLAAHAHGDYLPVNTTATMPTGTTRYNCEGYLYASKIYGAVWNDYAEYRACDKPICPGMVVIPDGNVDKVRQCDIRRAVGARVVSDTFGFAIGKTSESDVPIAVAGRVLAHTDKDRSTFHVGDIVCSGRGGTVSRMRRWEAILFPDRILGTVSHIPHEKDWHGIPVSGRVWIEVR